MEDSTFVAFCHFITDIFSGISHFSLLLQKDEVILPQVRDISKPELEMCFWTLAVLLIP